MRPARTSLAIRFILFTSTLVLLTALTLGAFSLMRYESRQDEQIRHKGVSLVRSLAHNAELGVLTRNPAILNELARGLFQDEDVIGVSVVDREGALLLDERIDASPGRLVAIADLGDYGDGTVRLGGFAEEGKRPIIAYEMTCAVFTQRGGRQDEEVGFLEEPSTVSGSKEMIGYARVMLSLESTRRDLSDLKLTFGLLTFIVIAVAIMLTVMLVRLMAGPLQALAAATHRIAEGNLDETVTEEFPGEIGDLARAFNRMTSDLKRSRRELESYSADLENQVRLRTRELEEAQNQLVQAEKMSALGLLVSGVAHELNNPLAGVVGYSQLLLRSGADERVRQGLEKINREAERCKRIVQNLQTFARKRKPQKDRVGVNGILESTLELRSYQLKVDNIGVEMALDPEVPMIQADFHQLQQVFLNIVINAHQAMKQAGRPGMLHVSTRYRDGMVVAEIRDNGPGIAPEDLGRIFDPFFTTKEVGQGTGLGLSICYGIVQEHQGWIGARNAPTGGAIFSVALPVADLDAPPERVEQPAPEPVAPSAIKRNILVVDDELAILDILRQVLRADGHRVDTALNGAVAMRKIDAERYDVIISDLRMPGMSGQELYEAILHRDPSLAKRVLFSTGDVVNTETNAFLERCGNNYLQKPFEIDALRRAVHDVLRIC